MRSLIVWTLWMGSIIFLIANTPSFFPEWFQAFVWGVGGSAGLTLTAYAIHIRIKNDQILGLEKDITRHEKNIEELRKRLGDIELDSIYKTLSNEELKNKTTNHISEIKDFIQKTKLSLEYQRNESNNLMVLAAERRGEGLPPLLKEGHEYWKRFNNETLVLRDELLKRLPASFKCQNNEYKKLYEMPYLEPFGLREVEQIAADLERLAENLFINQSSDISSQTSAS